MTFRQAVLEWRGYASKLDVKKIDKFTEAAARHPRLWKMAENMVLASYERKTGTKIVGKPDWSTIIDWLITNGPAILKLIMSIIAMFG